MSVMADAVNRRPGVIRVLIRLVRILLLRLLQVFIPKKSTNYSDHGQTEKRSHFFYLRLFLFSLDGHEGSRLEKSFFELLNCCEKNSSNFVPTFRRSAVVEREIMHCIWSQLKSPEIRKEEQLFYHVLFSEHVFLVTILKNVFLILNFPLLNLTSQ